ncbi:MAG: hypothetical protein OXG96_11525 [Acidobacteria bacterium]|nr:hypothetical protein [Acidobacteriota bacterium]
MAKLPRFKVGTKVIVDVTDEGFTVKPATPEERGFRFPYSEQALLAEMTPETAHVDALAEPTASEFGDWKRKEQQRNNRLLNSIRCEW